LQIPEPVREVGTIIGKRPLDFVFNGGADFSLVGTLHGEWSSERATSVFECPLEIVGAVESGEGVWLQDTHRSALEFEGWNYFRER
jgi:thiamine-monophosphate kinase